MLVLAACGSGARPAESAAPSVPVITIDSTAATTFRQYATSLQGVVNVEIRPQVEGYLEEIYVDEGQYVQVGQSLFLINAQPYEEQLNNASAAVLAAQANVAKARIEVTRLEKLVTGKVIASVQLENAQTVLSAVKAELAQAEAQRKAADINKGFTLIRAKVSGYIGTIPYKVGSLVGRNEPQPLTVLSDISKMVAYFSMSEKDFLQFKQQYAGKSIEEKIAGLPPVTLLLPDNSEYPEKGTVEMVSGQFNRETAAITFRASFPNTGGLLRTGNTGTLLLPRERNRVIRVPQAATFEMQNKVLAYVVGPDNKIASAPLTIADKDAEGYIVSAGLKSGDRIVTKGLDRLREGMEVKPAGN